MTLGSVGGRQAGAHHAGRDQALGPGLFQPVLGRADSRLDPRRRSHAPARVHRRPVRQDARGKEEIYKDTVNKWIDGVTVVGPFAHDRREAEPQADSRLRSEDGRRPASIAILSTLARRAYRRPVTGAEVAALTRFVKLATADGQTVEQGIGLAIQAMLVSPHFLFHIERDLYPNDPDADAPDHRRRAGVEAELLPVELDAGRGAAVARRAAPVERAGRARRAGEAHARRSESVRDWPRTSPASGWRSAISTASSPIRRSSRPGGPSCATR